MAFFDKMFDTIDTAISIHVLVSRSHTLSNGCGYMRLYMYSVLCYTVVNVWIRIVTVIKFGIKRKL